MSHTNQSLKSLNSFALEAKAKAIYQLHSIEQLTQLNENLPTPFYILGGGSNSLFIGDFNGSIICPDFKGIEITESEQSFHIHVASGENWHQLVRYCLKHNMPGLENLALIPGNCGAAPIQNIGAYGVEFADVCEYVDWYDFSASKVIRMEPADCEFDYRDSVFKNRLKNQGIIVAVGIKLAKNWQPILKYQGLNELENNPKPQQVFETVVSLRQSKLPDPDVLPNAGSFFKNPIIDDGQYQSLHGLYPNIPAYPQKDGRVKVAAGWLIQECQLKGKAIGGAAVHELQALVLVNKNDATGKDVIALARHVQACVMQKFSIHIEPEVRFINDDSEKQIEDIL